jgi:hypothetical protein
MNVVMAYNVQRFTKVGHLKNCRFIFALQLINDRKAER